MTKRTEENAALIYCLSGNGVEYSVETFAHTRSMLAGLSLIMDACANRVRTVFIVRWEYSC